MTRAGYLQWREGLKKFHAEKAGEILKQTGYPSELIARVQSLNLKKSFPNDPEGRILEDALCLVFLEHQLADLANKTAEDKVINALQKSWKKMTPQAQALAKGIAYAQREQTLLRIALGE
jgi:HD superfamily phosphodiesterase